MEAHLARTMLRKDAEIAHDEAVITECYAAIVREVRQQGQCQGDSEPSTTQVQRVEKQLRDTLREAAKKGDGPIPVADNALPQIPLFSALPRDAFVDLILALGRCTHAANAWVLREGDRGDSLFIVSAGELEVQKRGEQGQQIRLATLGPGTFFGEFALLTDSERHASVRCLTECELLELQRNDLAALVARHPMIDEILRDYYRTRVLQMVVATSPLFCAVTADDRSRMLSRFRRKNLAQNEVLLREGDESATLYVILLGQVAVSCVDHERKPMDLGVLAEGDYFGEMSLLSGGPAVATVRSVKPTELLTLDAFEFYDLTSVHPGIWNEVQQQSELRTARRKELLSQKRAQALLL
jgi:CRP-like cAMP-binding protein